MKIALTHEQADFDAIASLLGIHLVEKASSVLPHRMNRNVRSFIEKYHTDLPFITLKELPPNAVETAILVDTQSMVTVKGMSSRTKIVVFDHHARRANLNSEWETSLYDLGACTTVFAERIQENNIALTPLQATLLLLGIYEDTGSLTYTRTTVRDVRSAAFLMECGANLQIAGDYLYPPLSPDQRKLYDELLSNTEILHIHGLEIVLSRAFAEDMTDEVSSAAHKIRDLLEPDALFLLISTQEGIRLVARSTSDQVDVSTITAHFGGGGHQRAAAALIRRVEKGGQADQTGQAWRAEQLKQIYLDLTDLLPRFIQPAISVGEIMSTRPSMLSPSQSVKEASILMQRFGFEGFPVVDQGQVVGLLTRRAVDRALSHKLERRVGSLMDAGQVTIQSGQTLVELQALMNDTGWGQIPVVDPVDGQIVGIVTRTDLIRTLANRERTPTRQNLASKLEQALPKSLIVLLKEIAAEAAAQNVPMYLVGGFVRDLLLERSSLDLDIVFEGNAITLAQRLSQRFGGKIISHRRFGTAKWLLGENKADLAAALTRDGPLNLDELPDSLDLISARTEFYDHPTALPVVERSGIRLDLHRRDFSINTLALRLDGDFYGDLYDYWGGLNDLKNGFIRVLHSISFVDDPTRLLRAVRFEQRFDFTIEGRTLQLMSEAQELMKQVSGDRIRHELNAILNEPKMIAMLYRLHELGLLEAISPNLTWNSQISGAISRLITQPPDEFWGLPEKIGNFTLKQVIIYMTWFNFLLPEQSEAIARRLKLSSSLSKSMHEVHRAKEALHNLKQGKPSEYVKILQAVSPISLYILYEMSENPEIRLSISSFALAWHKVKPFADGTTLRQYQITPGPVYRDILNKLREAWLDGLIHTPEEEDRLLATLVKDL